MSVEIAASNSFAYMDNQIEGGGTVEYRASFASAKNGNEESEFHLFGEDGFGFDDFLDMINPLQHIPIISTLYREITGDEITPGSRIVGGGIFGGGIGLASSVVNTVIEAETGKDIGEHVASVFTGDDEEANSNIAAVETAPQNALASKVLDASAPEVAEKSVAPNAAATVQAASFSGNAPTAAMGLQWKKAPPNLHKALEGVQKASGQTLTDAQMSQILSSFNSNAAKSSSAPSAETAPAERTSVAPKAATNEYEKQVKSAPVNISQQYEYMDRII